MYLILFSPQIPLTDSKGFLFLVFFFKGCKSIRIEKTATKFWKLKSRWCSGTRIRREKMESQVCRGESKNQPDWPHTILKGLSMGSTRCLDMGVRVGGLKQGRPRWELWEVTHATRHLVLPNLQKSGGLFSGKVMPRALTGGARASWGKLSLYLQNTGSRDPPPQSPQLSSHNKGSQKHPSARLEGSSLEKVKQFQKHINVWT